MIALKKVTITFAISIFFLGLFKDSFAHCEIPCGIYGDSVRITLLYEHIATIEKSMSQIEELSNADDVNYNMLVRWVVNKEEHASEIQYIVSQYFLHQRIKIKDPTEKEAYKKYVKQLTLLHEMLVFAMKAKQSTDLTFIEKLREALHAFEHAYFE